MVLRRVPQLHIWRQHVWRLHIQRLLILPLMLLGLLIAAGPGHFASAAETAQLQPSPFALPAERGPVVVAEDSCANACQTRHNQCRVETKGSPACDEVRQRCLQACIAKKKN